MCEYYLFECNNCKSIKMVNKQYRASQLTCGCSMPNINLYTLFKDGNLCKLNIYKN